MSTSVLEAASYMYASYINNFRESKNVAQHFTKYITLDTFWVLSMSRVLF